MEGKVDWDETEWVFELSYIYYIPLIACAWGCLWQCLELAGEYKSSSDEEVEEFIVVHWMITSSSSSLL